MMPSRCQEPADSLIHLTETSFVQVQASRITYENHSSTNYRAIIENSTSAQNRTLADEMQSIGGCGHL